ncbi:MAG: hypothetical protein HOP09_01735 [Hyphomicrobium sp.]|nr:hypothetical protein [Hyphomicrobium sp.]
MALTAADCPPVSAKTPGTVHCYGGFCHYIHSVDEMDAMVGRRGYVKASYYDDCKRDRFNPCGLTSSGAVFHADRPDNAASPIFPDGTVLLTYNPETRLAAVLRVTSAGPYRGDRTLDVSRATAEQLGFIKQGVAALEVAILKSPEDHEARYSKLRTYAPVPGFLGKFATFDTAHDAAMTKMSLETGAMNVAAAGPRLDLLRLWPRGLAIEVSTMLPEDVAAASEPSLTKTNPVSDAATLRDAGPLDQLAAFDVGEANLDSAAPRRQANETVLLPGDLATGIASVFEIARGKARLSHIANGAEVEGIIGDEQLTFYERIKAFIRAAQVRARLGASGRTVSPSYWRLARD